MLRKVLKRIPKGRGEYVESGTILDVSGWRNVKMLEAGRYLGKVTDEEAKAHAEASKPKPAPAKAKAVKPVAEKVADTLKEDEE